MGLRRAVGARANEFVGEKDRLETGVCVEHPNSLVRFSFIARTYELSAQLDFVWNVAAREATVRAEMYLLSDHFGALPSLCRKFASRVR